MKQFARLAVAIIITLTLVKPACSAQNTAWPFEVKKNGSGIRSVIFIPGFACSGEVWKDTKSVFEKDFTCYTLTMAGFAGVAPQLEPTFQNWERGIAAFIQQSNIDKPVLIGHSMGGGLAMALAADYPRLISEIIVVDALPCLPALMNPSFRTKENNDCSALLAQITSATDAQFFQMQKATIPQLLADTSKQQLVVNWSVTSDRVTFAKMYCDFSNTDLREKLAAVTCPALILLEPGFASIQPAIREQFKNLRTAKLEYATKGLHFIMYDDKDWYLNQLSRFLKR